MSNDEPEERRLRKYFLTRAVEFLELAKSENDAIRKLALEERVAAYWEIAKR
jgi:hypothetical protein